MTDGTPGSSDSVVEGLDITADLLGALQQAIAGGDLVQARSGVASVIAALDRVVSDFTAQMPALPPVLTVTPEHHREAVALATAFVDGAGDDDHQPWSLLVDALNDTAMRARDDVRLWPAVAVSLCNLIFDALSAAVVLQGCEEDVPHERVQELLSKVVMLRHELL